MKKIFVSMMSCIALLSLTLANCVMAESFTASTLNQSEGSTPSYFDQLWTRIDGGSIELERNPMGDISVIIEQLPELEKYTDYIVSGTFLNDSYQDVQAFPDGRMIYGCTITSFRVDQVIKGDLQTGDIIKLGEEYAVGKRENKEYICYEWNYLPSKSQTEYLFFLQKTPETNRRFGGIYGPVQNEKGRYPYLNVARSVDELTNSELSLGTGDSAIYKSLYKAVAEKYMQQNP